MRDFNEHSSPPQAREGVAVTADPARLRRWVRARQGLGKEDGLARLFGDFDDDELDVLGLLIETFRASKEVYGPLLLEADKRDFGAEANQELVDFPLWASMEALKRRLAGGAR